MKGTPNKVSVAFKETVTALLDDNRENVSRWLKTVAEGDAEKKISPDPGKALTIITGLAEYAYPKLARTELAGDPDKPQEMNIRWLTEK